MPIPVSRRLDFSEIPQIDLSTMASTNPDPAVVEQLSKACTEVGFFYVHNHGIDPAFLKNLLDAAKDYFALPMDVKMQNLVNQQMRGYLPLNYQSYKGETNAARSRQEGFWVGYDRPFNPDVLLHGPNQWPDNQNSLKTAMLAYFKAVETLSQTLLTSFELALKVPRGTLSDVFDTPMSMLKLNHYPHQSVAENVNDIGVVPHTDSGAFTILWQDNGSGLEIQNKSGEWISAPSIENTFVINLGNVMQTWTNGRFSSTPHRVINRENRERYSIPVFVNPSHSAKIGPLDIGSGSHDDTVEFSTYLQNLYSRTFPVANIPPTG